MLEPNKSVPLDTDQHRRVIAAIAEISQPDTIGRYRIIGVLGHGGMGTVYEAEQDRPHRRVALKVIRPGVISPNVLKRFEYEAEVLARLDHPGIARIYDAGTADFGAGAQPYFAMELVHGERLNVFALSTRLSTTERLQLLIEICSAVHHAHTKGVIHRDLKPANILITETGKPKVLDFGVARTIDSDLQHTTLATESGQLVGTLPYMAPEQAAGKVAELDTSSDVYALGVIAYELLSGTMPYKLDGKPLHEAVRVICEDEPSRLSSVDKSLRGDVETIVQKALEKDRLRRYRTAGEFAADVKRFLDYEPIAARPPSLWYQLTRFAKRNKVAVCAAGAVFAVLVAATAVSTTFAVRERWQRHEADDRSAETNAVYEFFTFGMLERIGPAHLQDRSLRDKMVEVMLDPAAAEVAARFKNQPLIEAAVRNSLAIAYESLGRTELALPHATEALNIRRRILGDKHAGTLLAMNNLGVLLQARGDLDAAEPLLSAAMRGRREVLGREHADTLQSIQNYAALLEAQGKPGDAEPYYREALAISRRVLGDNHPTTIILISNMGVLLYKLGQLEQAEPLVRESLERRRRVLGENDPDTIMSISNLASILQVRGKLDEAEPLIRQTLQHREQMLGENHPDTIKSVAKLASLLEAQGKLDEAGKLYADVVEKRRQVLGEDHPSTLQSVYDLAGVLEAQDRLAEAEPLLAELNRRAAGAQVKPKDAALYAAAYGVVLEKLGRHGDAEEPLRLAEVRLRDAGLSDHKRMKQVQAALAALPARGTTRPAR